MRKDTDYMKKYREANKERLSEYAKEYYSKNKEKFVGYSEKSYAEHRELYISRSSTYQKENREKTNAKNRMWCSKNKEKCRIKTLNYRRENKAWATLCTQKRNALKLSNGVYSITQNDIDRLLCRQRRECFWCGKGLENYHIDHVIPLSRGGRHSIGNIVISCPECNCKKSTLLPIEFRIRQGSFSDRRGVFENLLDY